MNAASASTIDASPDAGGAAAEAGTSIAADVRRLIRAAAPAAPVSLADDLPLGRGGLGFDSVRLVELLIACEDHFGVPFPAELVQTALTIGALVAHASRNDRRAPV
jgi:acyl carrier protein